MRILKIYRKILDFLIPPTCLKCRTPLSENGALCPRCWGQLHFLSAPFCPQCAFPFETASDPSHKCAPCLKTPPPFSAARAVLVYNQAARPLLTRFKHGGGTHMVPVFSQWMVRAGQEVLGDVIIPVPLHWTRLLKRGYNQSALLAQQIGKMTHIRVDLFSLKRTRATPPQGSKGAEDRHKNVRNAFSIKHPHHIKGKKVTLVDDVMTTGATLQACARVLRKAGAKEVTVLLLARTPL